MLLHHPWQGTWAVTFSSPKSPLSPILSPILLTNTGRASTTLRTALTLSYAQPPGGDGMWLNAQEFILLPSLECDLTTFLGYFLRPASTDMLIFHNYHCCQWKVLSSIATAGAMQLTEQGI